MSEFAPIEDLGEITGSLPDDQWNDLYEKLVLEATAGGKAPGFEDARAHYFARTGEVYTDDEDYNQRMSLFLDWFVFVWKDEEGRTPAEKILGDPESGLDALEGTRHSIFEFLGDKGGHLRLRDLITGEKLFVVAGPQSPFLTKEGLIEARLVNAYDGLHLVGPICLHPGPAKKVIVKRLKVLRKEFKDQPDALPARAEDLMLHLRELRVRASRYAHVDPAKIYGEALAQ